MLHGRDRGFFSPTRDLGENLGHRDLVLKTLMILPHMGTCSGSFLGRKTLVQTPYVFLTSPQFCAVHFSFE